MKFKKSYLLVISLISILLCISAVNATTDIDNEIISDSSHSDTLNEITDNTDNQKLSEDNNNKDKITKDNKNQKLSKNNNDDILSDDNQEQINTTTESKNVEVKYNDSIKLNVNVKDNESKTITGLTDNSFEVFKGSESEENKVNFTYKDSAITLNNTLDSGLYSFIIKYLGNTTYKPSNTTISVTIFQNIIETGTSVNVNNNTGKVSIPITIKTYNGTVINVTKEDIKLNLTYFDGTTKSELIDFDYVNETKTINFTIINKLNNATITIRYKEDDPSNMTLPVVVKLNPYDPTTTIESSDVNIKFNDTVKLNVIVYYNGTNVVTGLTKDNFNVFNGSESEENKLNFTYKDSIITLDKKFPALGVYTLLIKYLGKDDTYTESNTTINVTVFQNIIITEPSVEVNINTGKVSIPVTIEAYNGTVINVTKEDIKLNLTYFDGTTNKSELIDFDYVNETKTINFTIDDSNKLNNAIITIYYKKDDSSNMALPAIIKLNPYNPTTTVNASNVEFNYTDPVKLNVTVYYNGTNIVTGLTKDDFQVFNGSESEENKLNFTYKDSIITLNATSLKSGLNNLLIKFLGITGHYNASNTTVNATIYAIINPVDSINVDKEGLKVIIPITIKNATGTITPLKDYFNLTITYNNQTENKTEFTFDGSNIIFNIDNDKLNNTILTVKYLDANNPTHPIKINLKPVLYLIVDNSEAITEYQSGNFIFKITTDINGNPIVNESFSVAFKTASITFQNSFKTDSEGNLIIPIDAGIFSYFGDLTVGKYNLTIKPDSRDYVLNKTTYEIEVTKAKARIIVSDYDVEFGETIHYIVDVVNDKTIKPIKYAAILFTAQLNSGEVQRNLTTNTTGQTYININLNAGNYPITISSRDSNIEFDIVSKTLIIRKRIAVIEASDITVPYNTGVPLRFTVKDKETGNVLPNTVITLSIYTGSTHKDYTARTNDKGQVNVNFITDLSLGTHKMVLGISDSNYNADSVTKSIKIVKTNAKFSATKVKTYYNSGKVLTIKLKTTKGKPIYSANINVRLYITKTKYYRLAGKTNIDGLLKIGLLKLKPGTYKVVIMDNDAGYTAKKATSQIKITKAPVKISPSKFKAKSGKKLKIKVSNKYTKKGVKGLKLKVKVSKGKTSKTYTIKSNKKGIAYLKIKQKPGKYKVVISTKNAYYKAKKTKTTIRVKK